MEQEEFWNETSPRELMRFFGFDESQLPCFEKAVWYMDLDMLWESPDFRRWAEELEGKRRKEK